MGFRVQIPLPCLELGLVIERLRSITLGLTPCTERYAVSISSAAGGGRRRDGKAVVHLACYAFQPEKAVLSGCWKQGRSKTWRGALSAQYGRAPALPGPESETQPRVYFEMR